MAGVTLAYIMDILSALIDFEPGLLEDLKTVLQSDDPSSFEGEYLFRL
jgi:hypothetical protein